MPETIQTVVDRALQAYATLTELGESIDDEWSYVNDLSAAWGQRLDELAGARGSTPAPQAAIEGVDRAIDEIGLIEDPHRAIDWLSTFPQVVLLALGEVP